ncbi:MAG: 4Fe-4S dicluster domain-containing protein [candidate division WOR-3 bacterium]
MKAKGERRKTAGGMRKGSRRSAVGGQRKAVSSERSAPRILTRAEFDRLIDELVAKCAVYAPVAVEETGKLEFRRIGSSSEVKLEGLADVGVVGQLGLRPKELLFPQCEVLFHFSPSEPGRMVEPEPPQEQVLFGVRPCDGAAVAFLDRFFSGRSDSSAPSDIYYRARRERTTLVGLACNRPADTCFCRAVGGSPSGTTGLDLLLTDLSDGFLAEPVTEKGAALVADMPVASQADMEKKQRLAENAGQAITTTIDTASLKRRLDRTLVSEGSGPADAVWQALSLPCVNCGVCTFLCPTCRCFDVTDEEFRGRGRRMRVWDSCQFTLYSRHASGHNPRATPHSRFRNRVMDKFSYTVAMVGELSCVGCGRCISACPNGIDIRETVETLLKMLPE